MHILYQNPRFDYSINSIMLFQTEDQTPFWSEALPHFYPQIHRQELARRSLAERRDYISEVLYGLYHRELKAELDQKADSYNLHFLRHKSQIEEALSDAFALDAGSVFNDLLGNVTLNPISPRFLTERRFDLFYKNSERGALGMSLHEVIHYFWFHVWNRHFGDSYAEYESPSLKWILSEMVVEPIMADPRLSSLNPYFPKENGGCVYPYFQNMILEGAPILETLSSLYRQNTIQDFMEAAYAYCQKQETAIRSHIREAEQNYG